MSAEPSTVPLTPRQASIRDEKGPARVQAALATKYRPTFHFHPDELYYPISFDAYVSGSDVMIETDSAGAFQKFGSGFTAQQFVQIGTDPDTPEYKRRVTLRPKHDIRKGAQRNALDQTVPLYYVVTDDPDETDILIEYYVMFAFNGAYECCGAEFDSSVHFADVESVSVFVDRESEDITRAHFFAHRYRDGVEKRASTLRIEDNHLHVWVALDGHGMYPKPKRYSRILCFADDQCADGGVTWTPQLLRDYTSHPIAKFNGYLGFPDSVSPPHLKSRYRSYHNPSTTTCRRVFGCCC